MQHKRRVPRFYGMRIFGLALLLYFLLTASVFLILGIQSLPRIVEQYPWVRENAIRVARTMATEEDHQTGLDTVIADIGSHARDLQAAGERGDERMGRSVLLLHLIVVPIVTLVGAALVIQPYSRYLYLKKREKEIPARLAKFCRATIRHTPLAFGALVLLPHVVLYLIVSGGVLAGVVYPEAGGSGQLLRFLVVGFVAALLQAMFVQAWQRYRVQMVYLEQFFTPEELESQRRQIHVRSISNRLWLTSTMTTFLPIAIIVSYVAWSVGSTGPLLNPEAEELSVLLGKYAVILSDVDQEVSFLAGFMAWASRTLGGLWYVNAVDSMLMFAGIASGALITVVYAVLLIRWTTGSIVGPVRDLVRGMRKSAGGEFDHRAVVRERDEIGELTAGFNQMNDQLGDYFARVSRLNTAYHRFVPEQFLQILGRERIEDIALGDQVQREMTLLFCDIRSFSSHLERMTPAESFQFINEYLGVMEPEIVRNEGFIDKYIGDAIMAIFDARPANAVRAGLAMRRALVTYNRDRKQAGTFPVQIGIGIHTGTLMLGLVGGAERMDGTVISDAVNVASRLEGLTKHFGCQLIASDATCGALGRSSDWSVRPLGSVVVPGRADPVGISEVLDPARKSDVMKRESLRQFETALGLYRAGQFSQANEAFESIAATNKADGPARYFAAHSRHHAARPPAKWDGVERFSAK